MGPADASNEEPVPNSIAFSVEIAAVDVVAPVKRIKPHFVSEFAKANSDEVITSTSMV